MAVGLRLGCQHMAAAAAYARSFDCDMIPHVTCTYPTQVDVSMTLKSQQPYLVKVNKDTDNMIKTKRKSEKW